MPSNTINFNLPYPNDSDEPCDFAEQWCDFTAALDGVFDTFQSAIDRTIPAVPMAIIQRTSQVSIGNFNPISFDTVLVDTARMTDIDADPFTITIKRPGRYTVAAMVSMTTTVVGAEISIFIEPNFTAQAEVIDKGAGVLYYLTTLLPVETHAVGDQIRVAFSVGNQNFFFVEEAWLAAIWHSDTEVP